MSMELREKRKNEYALLLSKFASRDFFALHTKSVVQLQ